MCAELFIISIPADNCGGQLVTQNHTFGVSIPPYKQFEGCVWIIDAQKSGTIELRFNEPFDVGKNAGKDCGYDYIKVQGGRYRYGSTYSVRVTL